MPGPDSKPAQQVDLTNCDREPIHIPGRVQAFGCLIAVSSDWMIVHAAENCAEMLGRAAEDLIGINMSEIFPAQSVHDLRTRIQFLSADNVIARIFRYDLFQDGAFFDVSVHRSGRMIVYEFEPRPATDMINKCAETVHTLIQWIGRQHT